jgi:hypothetical protein
MTDLAAMESIRVMSADSDGKERVCRPQVRSLHGPPIQSTTYVVPAQTLFPIKPVLDLFLEIGRLRFPVFHQRALSFFTIRGRFLTRQFILIER